MKHLISLVACCTLCFMMHAADLQFEPVKEITFYKVNLICGAAPDIGCGTRSKPMLAAFMAHDEVESAWLNHAGTVVAVRWTREVADKEKIANSVFEMYGKPFTVVEGEAKAALLQDFHDGKWYKGDDVDQLSLIEAERIADQLLARLQPEKALTPTERTELHAAFEAYIANEFLTITDANVIDDIRYWQRWEKELTAVGQSVIGDNMPDIHFVSSDGNQLECKTEKSCCTKGSAKACCIKKEGSYR